MGDSVKARDEDEADGFFAGVSEVRAHLDRRLQDPARRRGRLARVAGELLKPREPRELCRWLVTELAEALGASAAAVLVREGGGRLAPWHALGMAPAGGYGEIESTARSARAPLAVDAGVIVPLFGVEGAIGALWLQTRTPLDPPTTGLLGAIAETAGVALEQGLLLESMR